MRFPAYEAKRYEGRVKDGGILLSVHCDDRNWTVRAKQILERTGAQDVASTADLRRTGRKRQAFTESQLIRRRGSSLRPYPGLLVRIAAHRPD
jgi:hypothetical protein